MDRTEKLNAALAERYAVERQVGSGGMASVYTARDLRHGRRVAIKVLHADVGAMLGAQRFLSEIRVTAGLQHPNLLPLFDSGEADGSLFYVMPFIEGESLRGRLSREAQLPVEEAIRIAVAIAGALDYAHRNGIVHRDLKPENVLLREGQPLVADFGIALAVSGAGDRITQSGITVGTPQYMAPEQAAGDRKIDGRTDVYALGVMLYEMLAGEPPHTGATAQALIGRIISEVPRSVRAARSSVPEHVDRAIARALAKLPADRFDTAREFAHALTEPSTHAAGPAAIANRGSTGMSRHRRTVVGSGVALATLAAGTAIGAAVAGRNRTPDVAMRIPLVLPRGLAPAETPMSLALSPDGSIIALVVTGEDGVRRVVVRTLKDAVPRELAGTRGATQVFFSPDGKWVAFYESATLRKVPVSGGTPVVIGEVPDMLGASWGRRDQIVVSSNGALATIPAAGGRLTAFSAPRGNASELAQILPQVLSDGSTIIYTSRTRFLEQSTLSVTRLGDSATVPLNLRGTAPLGVVDGLLIFATARNTTERNDLMAARFDERKRIVTGTPVPVVDGVVITARGVVRAVLSASGALMYRSADEAQFQLVMIEPGGSPRVLLAEPRQYLFPRFAPDGKRVAVSFASGTSRDPDVHILDIASGALSLVTPENGSYHEWTPDGKRIIYSRLGAGRPGRWLSWRAADLNGPEELLFYAESTTTTAGLIPPSQRGSVEAVMAPDGEGLVIRMNLADGTRDLWYWRRGSETAARPLVTGPGDDFGPRISPDGRWLAWFSSEPGGAQVYVTPLSGAGVRYRVSPNGGGQPIWAPDGKRLFYLSRQVLLAAHVTLEPRFAITRMDTLIKEGYQFSGRSMPAMTWRPTGAPSLRNAPCLAWSCRH